MMSCLCVTMRTRSTPAWLGRCGGPQTPDLLMTPTSKQTSSSRSFPSLPPSLPPLPLGPPPASHLSRQTIHGLNMTSSSLPALPAELSLKQLRTPSCPAAVKAVTAVTGPTGSPQPLWACWLDQLLPGKPCKALQCLT